MNLREKLEKRKAGTKRWNPEVNDVLIGEVKAIRPVTTQFGDGKIADIETKEGMFTVFLTAVLRTQFLQHDVTEGTRVGIKYLGEEHGKSGRSYKNYAIATDNESKNKEETASINDQENQKP